MQTVFLSPRGEQLESLPLEANVWGFVPWMHLGSMLRAAGAIKSNEHVVAFKLSDTGIEFAVETKR